MSLFFPPVRIDSAGFGDQSLNTFAGVSTAQGPWLVNGALYICLIPTGDPSGVPAGYPGYVGNARVWKSTNGGQTWTEQDSAHAPTCAQGQSCFDGNHTIAVAITPAPTPNPGDTLVAMNVITFNITTGLWGALSANSPFSHHPGSTGPFNIASRPDGSYLILFPFNNAPNPLANVDSLDAVQFSGGAWGAPFAIDANAKGALPSYQTLQYAPLVVVDPATGITHVFFSELDNSDNIYLFYQAITAANGLGSFFQFPGVGTVIDGAYGIPCIVGNNLVFPVYSNPEGGAFPAVYIGSPLSGPGWTLHQNIDPAMATAQPAGMQGLYTNSAQLVNGVLQIVAIWPTVDSAFNNGVIRISSTTDFVNWVFTSVTGYNVETDGPTSFKVGGAQLLQVPVLGVQGMALRALEPTDTNFVRYWFQWLVSVSCNNPPAGSVGVAYSQTFPASGGTPPYTFSIVSGALPNGLTLNTSTGVVSGTPTVAGTFPFTIQVQDSLSAIGTAPCSITITGSTAPVVYPTPQYIPGGGPPAVLCPRPINRYDLCAEAEVRRTKRIHFPDPCTIPRNLLAWDEDGVSTPAQAVPFNVQGNIVTPATAAGDVLVCSGRVPLGYDGLLTEIYQIYQGAGFQQGSGDIVWRIRRNQVWLKMLGNNPFSLGNPRNPVGLTEGEVLYSGTQFFFYVNVPNLSGMIQVGGSLISCGMRGFYWPRG